MEYIVKVPLFIDGVQYLPNRDGRADVVDEKTVAAFLPDLVKQGVLARKPEEKPTAKNKGEK